MSETDTHNKDFTEAFKFRLMAIPFIIVFCSIAYGINKGLWSLDKIIVMSLVMALVPIKFLVIIMRYWQVWLRENKNIVFLLFLPIVLLLAFLFDFETVPKLLTYSIGAETQGHVVNFIVTNTKTRFVIYEFPINDVVFKKQQIVSMSYYETLRPGAVVTIDYLQNNPKVSFLADLDYLKFETMSSLFLVFCIIASLYVSEIEEKLTSIKIFISKNPPNTGST